MVVVVVRGGERKLEMSSSNLSSGSGGGIEIAAALEEDEVVVVEGCFDFVMSPLDLSRLEGGVGGDDRLLMLACPWLRTDEVFAGRRRDIEGASRGPGRRVCFSGAPGSCFILTPGTAVHEATEARGKFGLDFGGFIVAAVECIPFTLFRVLDSSSLLSPV